MTEVVFGTDQLDKQLRKLGTVAGAKALRGAMMDGAKVLADEIKKQAPVGDTDYKYQKNRKKGGRKGETVKHQKGHLRKSVKRKSKLNKSGGARGFRRGEVVIVKTGVFFVPYVGAIEYGTGPRKRGGPITPNPFVRRSWDAKKFEALAVIERRIQERIKKEMAKK